MITQRPLSSLPFDVAADLVAELFGTDRAGARALGRGQDGGEVIAVGDDRDGGFVAAAIYALAPLTGHPLARRLTGGVGGPERFAGPFGIVSPIAVRDGRDLAVHAAIVSGVAHRALARLYGAVFFCALDRGLAEVYRRFGLEFPAELAQVGPAIGVLDPNLPSSLAILRALDQGHDLAA